jgi:hypothetical protein
MTRTRESGDGPKCWCGAEAVWSGFCDAHCGELGNWSRRPPVLPPAYPAQLSSRVGHNSDCICPYCVSDRAERRALRVHTDQAVPWDRIEVRFRVRNRDAAQDIGLCDELPHGWELSCSEPRDGGFYLVFNVQGGAFVRDGFVVRRIIERLGML